MALRVWLPLNGTLENKGISNTTMSGSPASWGNGKIGKCATFTGNAGNVIYNNTTDYNYTDNFSWAVWINTNYTGTTAQYAFTNGRADAGGYGYGLQCSNTTTCNIRFGNQGYGVAVTGGEWTHLAFTKSGTSIKIYKNGSIVTDTTFTGTLPTYSDGNGLGLGCFHYSGNIYPFYGSLNDFRIYDHCLSPKEVKEISQGLVLHYKLDGWSGGSGENLVWNSNWNKNSTSPPESWTNWGSPPTREIVQINNKYWLHVISNTTQFQGYSQNWTKRAGFGEISAGEILTVSFTAYLASAASIAPIGIHWCNTSSTIVSQVWTTTSLTATPIRYSFTYTTPADCAGFNIMVGDNTNTAHEIWITDIKVERGSVATPWSPAPQDLGIDTTKVTDSSGYGNDGTITGTLSTESDSNRYEISIHYPGSSYTDTGSGAFNWFDFSQCTLSAWIKPTASVSGWSGSIGVQHNQNAGHKGFSITDYANNFRVVTVNGSYTTIDSGKPLTVGEWHHCAAVLNGTNLKMYYDGAMVKESTVSWGSAAIATDMRFATGVDFPGSDEMFTGNYSDVRMYCTALSAEDILDLYHTPANIDNLQNIHAFELKDNENTSQILKNGVMTTKEFHESNSELLNSFLSGGYAPAKNTNNSCVDMGIVNFTNYASLNKDLPVHIECDVKWTAFTADTGGTFKGIWWQGSNYKKETSAYAWEGTNYVCSILNSTKSLQNVTTVASPGKYHYDVTTTIPASWFNTYSRSYVGFRCDYSDGTGRIDVTNFKVTPLQYYNARIGKNFISANDFIEK